MPFNPPTRRTVTEARSAWEESMLAQVERLRAELAQRDPAETARRSGAEMQNGALQISYWDQMVLAAWPGPSLEALEGRPLSLSDQAMLLYYLHTADGAPLAERWVSFRELPGGGFYHQAFQGYSGDLLAAAFAASLEKFSPACIRSGGQALEDLSPFAFAFAPLPKIRLAAVIWPGDEDFPTKAGILFDAAGTHYLPIDGLAMLGAGLARRIIRAA